MTEEKVDQIIRCVKECWWRVAIVFSIPSLALVISFTTWPWGESPWAAGSALGAFFAGSVALYISNKESRKSNERAKAKLKNTLPMLVIEVESAHQYLSFCIDKIAEEVDQMGDVSNHFLSEAESSISRLMKDIDFEKIDILNDVSPHITECFYLYYQRLGDFVYAIQINFLFGGMDNAEGVDRLSGLKDELCIAKDNLNRFSKALGELNNFPKLSKARA